MPIHHQALNAPIPHDGIWHILLLCTLNPAPTLAAISSDRALPAVIDHIQWKAFDALMPGEHVKHAQGV
jgi:hypothetical protein